ncbi:hypothetical protein CEUSTIGMA_g1976.t1 [Chlamydomonas eustigma]|uniref:Peptidoglycan binding-like domain-containing protein n=1 Tax=Chlamydomonas eustigma TaxID=1157962 RepID=A0A250WUM4_9CHLO|nr:hypothetical protein CEUSTIGMA_g1976.t1 [Chlamydomonas eustigma]|eukprot:GAX74527.1 hypothetical protein CEUSTIGMA_g1976.t1 [Chlamydomonas eustigma]
MQCHRLSLGRQVVKASAIKVSSWENERNEWLSREQNLLRELAATRSQVDKLLDQHQMLLSVVLQQGSVYKSNQEALIDMSRPPPLSVPNRAHLPEQVDLTSISSSHNDSEEAATISSISDSPQDSEQNLSIQQLFREWGVVASESPFDNKAASLVTDAMREAEGKNLMTGSSGLASQAGLGEYQERESNSVVAQATKKPANNGFPPELFPGEDDIYWMGRLHVALLACGCCGWNDEMESWSYGHLTKEALISFQASQNLKATGVADKATWQALLTQLPKMAEDIHRDIREGKVPNTGSFPLILAAAPDSAAPDSAAAEALSAQVETLERMLGGSQSEDEDESLQLQLQESVRRSEEYQGGSSSKTQDVRWPIVQEGDGGKEVRMLQACLEDLGFYCGEEDMRWWMFGDTTHNSLMAFQASSGLPQSGVCEEATWRALLGPHAKAEDLLDAASSLGASPGAGQSEGSGFSDDLTLPEGRGVWLLGEQRWEKSS